MAGVMPTRHPHSLSGMRHGRHEVESLHEIGLRHGTDKAPLGYSHVYGELLDPLRAEAVTILELGWGGYGGLTGAGGESARMWVDGFPKGRVLIVDNNPGSGDVPDRCELIVGDQADRGLLTELVARFGGLDIVVDDASHIGRLSRESFEIIWPHVNPGGWYFIEDVTTSYLSDYEGHPDPADVGDTAVDLTKHLVDVAQAEGAFAAQHPTFLDYVEPIGLDRVLVTSNLVALRKTL